MNYDFFGGLAYLQNRIIHLESMLVSITPNADLLTIFSIQQELKTIREMYDFLNEKELEERYGSAKTAHGR